MSDFFIALQHTECHMFTDIESIQTIGINLNHGNSSRGRDNSLFILPITFYVIYFIHNFMKGYHVQFNMNTERPIIERKTSYVRR